MKSIVESVVNCFEKVGLRFSQCDDDPIFKIIGKGESGLLTTYVHADEDRSLIECFTICPLTVSQDRMMAVFELIARINWKLGVGNFDIDTQDGEIRFRTSIRLGNIELDHETIAHLIFMNLTTTDMFVPAIASVVCSRMTPEEALEMLKRTLSKEDAANGHTKQFDGRLGNMSIN